jgi:protein TonB
MDPSRPLVSGFALLVCSSYVPAQQPKYSPTPPIISRPAGATYQKAKAVTLFAPKPEYPKYARDRRWTGVGWFVMHVDVKTGLVKSVDVTKSTGHKVLDDACVDALSRWRFKTGVLAPVLKTPITFSLPVEQTKS